MDDTTQSRVSDVASAATRKRRSSILKSQRPPRTPFCELEFNVATPTDTTKSRRVSFSRRTGVAEFVTNEATTTWKNFYEEHNKSLESSGNDSAMNNKQPIAHLGKRVFDDQFEEVEAVDYMGLNPGMNISSSINNINFIDNTESIKLTAPHNNFELSTFTETQSKLFGKDLAVQNLTTGEVSDRIDVNFSTIDVIGEKDDLDEIQKDLARNSNIGQRPFGGQNISEYIEVDLDVTHAAIVNDESDMSITDTIHSPKVQDVSKSCSIEKKVSVNQDWVVDKENLPVNPYVAPRESLNFAVNEEPDKVLIFDGKKLVVETERPKSRNLSYADNAPDKVPQRKTIVLNCNDDLPNFLEESLAMKNSSHLASELEQRNSCNQFNKYQNREKTIIYDDFNDISVTQAIPNIISDINTEKGRTILYDDNKMGNISITQALPTNILDKEKRRTIVYDNENANISITQAVPNLLIPSDNTDKRRTIVFENEACNISLTQAIPVNIIVPDARRTILLDDGTSNVAITQPVLNPKESKESRRTVLYEDNSGNISVTQSMTSSASSNEKTGRRTTVVFDGDVGNISVTQALPSNILAQQVNATKYDDEFNISVTQAVPVNFLLNQEPCRRRTVVFEDGNLSITQAVPKNQVIQGLLPSFQDIPETNHLETATNKTLHFNNEATSNRTVFDSEDNNMSITQAVVINQPELQERELTGNKRRTIVFQNDAADISITQAVPIRQVIDNIQTQKEVNETVEAINAALHKDNDNKRRTIVFGNEDADISMTPAVSLNKVLEVITNDKNNLNNITVNRDASPSRRKTHIFEHEDADISMTQAVPTNQVIEAIKALQNENTDKRRTVVFENEEADISVTQAVHMNQVIDILKEEKRNDENKIDVTNKRRTVVFDSEDANISVTQAVPMNQLIENILKENVNNAISMSIHKEDDVKTEQYEDDKDISMTDTEPVNQDVVNIEKSHSDAINIANKESSKRQTVVFENDEADISMTEAISAHKVLDMINKENIQAGKDKSKTLLHENENADISLTPTVSDDQICKNKKSDQSIESVMVPSNQSQKTFKSSTVFDSDNADISISNMINAHQVISGSINPSRHTITEIHSKVNMSKSSDSFTTTDSRNIVYDDDERDIVPSSVASTIILPNGEEKKRTIVVESIDSLLQNKELFMDMDKDLDFTSITKVKDDFDISMTDMSETDITNARVIEIPKESDGKSIQEMFSPKKDLCPMSFTEKIVTISKPIPKELASFQIRDLTVTQNKNNMLNFENPVQNTDVIVYQSLTANAQNSSLSATTEQTSSQETEEDNLQSGSSKTEMESNENESNVNPKVKSKILNELLDMSESSYDNLPENKVILFKTSSDETSGNKTDGKDSDNNMFYITKDSDDDAKLETKVSLDTISYTKADSETNKPKDLVDSISYTKAVAIDDDKPLSIEYKDDEHPSLVRETLKKLSGIKHLFRGESHGQKDKDTAGKVSLDITKRKSLGLKTANDTNELLDMISEYTDKRVSRVPALEDMREIDEEPEPEEREPVKERHSFDSKSDSNPQPLTQNLKRQSVVLSREDLLNNMSMASALLQKSYADFNDTESTDESMESPNISQRKKSVRISTDIVKQLHFDEDSICDKSDTSQTLKKTTFVDDSYTKEPKSKVIPSYLTVSDGIKELMDDLVKPTNDVVPFTAGNLDRSNRESHKQCKNSAEIQANLFNSSQIDLHTELVSATNSTYEMTKTSSVDIIQDAVNRSFTRSIKSSKDSEDFKVQFEDNTEKETTAKASFYTNNSVLIFDHSNPLNNVLLAAPAPHAVDIHRYNPITPIPTDQTSKTEEATKNPDKTIVSQYHVEFPSVSKYENQEKLSKRDVSNTSIPMSIDQYTEPEKSVVKDTETNTVITMKENKQLCQESSSLTLVDDVMQREEEIKDRQYRSNHDSLQSNVQLIYQVEGTSELMDSDITSATEEMERPKKRVYSPTKHKNCTFASLDVTPKPIAKLQKRSSLDRMSTTTDQTVSPKRERSPKREKSPKRQRSPKRQKSPKRQRSPERQRSPVKQWTRRSQSKSPIRQKSPKSPRKTKPGTTVTVQQLTTLIHRDHDADVVTDSSTTDPRSVCASDVLALATSSEIVSSFNSSNNLREASSAALSRVTLNPSRAEWVPESTSSFMVHGCDSVDLVSMIDAMPFMGSNDCQWESVSGSVWTLLLLHSRLRLTVRFAGTARVRGDTPVLSTELETLHQDKKNSIAYLCVLFAAEMMRYYMSRGCSTAIDVKKLIRRLGGAARLAAQWARTMHDARARLAYSLSLDGWLTLKVANTSYRTVWEVSMRLELVMEDARAAPWPRACGLRVTGALAAGGAAPPDVARLLATTPRDWGHVPRTIWKVFRYLKHKKRDDSKMHL